MIEVSSSEERNMTEVSSSEERNMMKVSSSEERIMIEVSSNVLSTPKPPHDDVKVSSSARATAHLHTLICVHNGSMRGLIGIWVS